MPVALGDATAETGRMGGRRRRRRSEELHRPRPPFFPPSLPHDSRLSLPESAFFRRPWRGGRRPPVRVRLQGQRAGARQATRQGRASLVPGPASTGRCGAPLPAPKGGRERPREKPGQGPRKRREEVWFSERRWHAKAGVSFQRVGK